MIIKIITLSKLIIFIKQKLRNILLIYLLLHMLQIYFNSVINNFFLKKIIIIFISNKTIQKKKMNTKFTISLLVLAFTCLFTYINC